MLTISQLAAYAGVTVRAVRHYHQIGLLPEPERDASGYRRYGATGGRVPHQDPHPRQRRRAAVSDRPDARSRRAGLRRSGPEDRQPACATRSSGLRPAASRSRSSRPGTVWRSRRRWSPISIGCGRSGRRSGWWRVSGTGGSWSRLAGPIASARLCAGKLAELEDPQLVRLYRVLSELLESDATSTTRALEEAADIMAGLFEQAYAAGEINLGEVARRRSGV